MSLKLSNSVRYIDTTRGLGMQSNPLRVGIQGVKASFHDVAAQAYFHGQTLNMVESSSFRHLCEALRGGHSDLCMMAVENSTVGALIPNLLLLDEFQFKICGEITIRVEMSLMALAGQALADLKFVHSHPVALLQCDKFLAGLPHLKILEDVDTAEAAKSIQAHRLMGHAAIAHQMSASVYGLEVLAKGIETNKENFTRFLVLARPSHDFVAQSPNRAAFRFETVKTLGGLTAILQCLDTHPMELIRLQGLPPAAASSGVSAFHAEVGWDGHHQRFYDTLEQIKTLSVHLRCFGAYRAAALA